MDSSPSPKGRLMDRMFEALLESAGSNPIICNLGKFDLIDFEDAAAVDIDDLDLSILSVRWDFKIPSSVSLEIVGIYISRFRSVAKDSGYVLIDEAYHESLKGNKDDGVRGVMNFSRHWPFIKAVA